MKDTRVARRYAAALFSLARQGEIVDAVQQDLALIQKLFSEVNYLRSVLVEPLVSEDRKLSVVNAAFGDRITETTLNFLKLLIRKRREPLIDECVREYRELVLEAANTVDAEARSAVDLSKEQITRLKAGLEQMTGKVVRLIVSSDQSVIGGVVVRIGDTVIDGTVQGRLERLQQHLMGASALGGMS